jgi:hypothetical protein
MPSTRQPFDEDRQFSEVPLETTLPLTKGSSCNDLIDSSVPALSDQELLSGTPCFVSGPARGRSTCYVTKSSAHHTRYTEPSDADIFQRELAQLPSANTTTIVDDQDFLSLLNPDAFYDMNTS